jgi:LuxR family maltose regulon positive regulatory protein
MLQALAHATDGDRETALGVLGLALTQAPEPEGHVRLFLDEGDPMLDLLRDAAQVEGPADSRTDPLQENEADGEDQRKMFRAFARHLLDRTPSGEPAHHESLAGPLSQREFDVLRLLDSELTGPPQIASELFGTLKTLRTHTKRIFTKLDVTTRAAAVRTVHELGLI